MSRRKLNKVVICHGRGDDPDSHWFPWLADKLGKRGFSVVRPRFPGSEGKNLENWVETFSQQVGLLNADTLLVGHGLGVGLILRLLEKSSTAAGGCMLVSGWDESLDLKGLNFRIEPSYRTPIDYAKVRPKLGFCRLYHGDDDPIVPLELGQELARKLQSDLTVISNGGQLDAAWEYYSFYELLDDIEDIFLL